MTALEDKSKTVKSVMVGMAVSAAILAVSPFVTGLLEPWDSAGSYYFIAMLFAGVVGSIMYPKNFTVFLTGIFLGQLIYSVLFLPLGPLFIVGIFVMAFYTLIALFAGLVTKAVL